MIFGRLNSKNVKLTIVDSNKNEDGEEIYIEILFNEVLLVEYVLTILLIQSYTDSPRISLTPREKEVIKYIADGKSNEEIASMMSVSVHTAKAHIHNIFYKMGVQDRTQAVVKAIKHRMLDIF